VQREGALALGVAREVTPLRRSRGNERSELSTARPGLVWRDNGETVLSNGSLIAMILGSVIERELRASARQRFTYTLRVLGGTALLVAFAFLGWKGKTGPGVGGELFTFFHGVMFFAIWLLVPLLSADCISRERREGTLPLLFLTPLKSWDIVWAKGLAHGLRALTLWLAGIPVLTVCFVAGGVAWREVVISVLVNLSALCLAMGAGVLASARARVRTRSLALSAALAFGLFLAFLWAIQGAVLVLTGVGSGRYGERTDPWEMRGLIFAIDVGRLWQRWPPSTGTGTSRVFWAYMVVAFASMLALLVLIRLAAWSLKQASQERPPSSLMLWLGETLYRPVLFRHALRRWLRWELEHNPIGWLERRSWNGRLVVWSWLVVVACIYSSLFTNWTLYERGFQAMQALLANLLAGGMAVSAAGSFRRERETGVLELLLVAPLRERQIITGRLWGLWSQFVPAVGLLCGVWIYVGAYLSTTSWLHSVVLYLVTFTTLPVVGLYFSLAKTNFIVALVWTLAVQWLLPAIFLPTIEILNLTRALGGPISWPSWVQVVAPVTCQVVAALVLGCALYADLKGRKFALDRRPD